MKTEWAERGNRSTPIVILACVSVFHDQTPYLVSVHLEMLVIGSAKLDPLQEVLTYTAP
jgi:hypothetical protein